MKKTKLVIAAILTLVILLCGCGTTGNVGANNLPVSKTEDENGVPDFVQAMYDEMGELTEMYGLCYEMVKEPAYHQMDTAEHNWCYFEFETDEIEPWSPVQTKYPSKETHEIQFNKDRGVQKKSFKILLKGDATEWQIREELDAVWTEIIAAAATCVEPDGDFEKIKNQVRGIVTSQEDDKYSKVLQFNDYTMVIAKRDAFVTYLYAVHDDEFWDEIDQTDYVPLNRENLLKTEPNDRDGLLVQMEGTVEAYELPSTSYDAVKVRGDDGFLYNIYFDMDFTPMTFEVGDRYRFFGELDNSDDLTQSLHYCEPIK